MRPNTLLSSCLAVIVPLLPVTTRAEVVVNEILAAGSDRLLRWSPAGVPKLGYGTPWQEAAYNDGAWLTGNGPFGFGSFTNVSPAPAIGTNVASQMVNLTPTMYLRKTFTATAGQAASASDLTLEVRYNDGFVCHINGVEVARRNAGAVHEFKFRDSFAAMGTPANTENNTTPRLRTETLSLGAANSRLAAGENVIAIHALNYWENTNLHNTTTNAFAGNNNSNNFYISADLKLGGSTTLVANNTSWKYLPGLVEPSGGVFDPGTLFGAKQNVPWGRPAYDDADWSSGPAPFGAGTPPSGVTLGTNLTAQIPGQAASLYLRTVFTATAAQVADSQPMQVLVDWDDGFVAYLNGVEIARDRLDLANSFTPHTAVATSARTPGGYATYTLDLPARLIEQGLNVLAIQVHNVHLNDSDLFLRAQLRTNPAGTNALLVPANATWKYFVGVSEPPVAEDEETDTEIEGPESSPDWIELRNTGAEPVSLAGWRLSDNPNSPNKWTFPAGASIPAGGYLIVICDGLDITDPAPGGYYHSNFRLSRSGESAVLSDAGGALVDSVTFGPQSAFESFGRDENGDWRYLLEPSPGAPNTGSVAEGRVEPVQFSVVPGFYPGSRSVALSTATPGATIRYTFDGTEPTETNGTTATSVNITISRALRARAFKTGLLPSETTTGTFLIGEPAARQSVPALCLVGDQERSLYRPYGVMAISGGAWTSFTSPNPTNQNGVWTQTGSAPGSAVDLMAYNNPYHRGRFTERPLNMELLRADGTPGPNAAFGIRMAGSPHARPRYRLTNQNRAPGGSPAPNDGAWSQTNFTEKPSFNFFFRGDYSDDLQWPLFPGYPVTQWHSLRIRAGKNDVSNPFIEDEYMRRLFIATGQVGSMGMINTLYVNGVYKGYYNLCEHLREKFFQQHYQSDKAWDVRQVTTIASGDGLAFQEMITFLRNNPQTSLTNYQGMKQRLDMVNFIDYLLTNVVGNTGDWPHNNFVCSRERSPQGRHRYHLWDAEGAFGDFGGNVRTNMFVAGTTGSIVTTNPNGAGLGEGIRILYTLLRASPEFKLLFADRIQKHFFNGGCFTEASMLARWNAMKAEFAPLIAPASITDRVTPWFNGVGDPARHTTSGVTNTPSRRNVLFHGYTDDTAGGAFVQAHFVAEGLWPATLAPQFSQPGGVIASPPLSLTLTNPNGAGTIYHTLDGSDPRAEGGAAQGSAYTGPLSINDSLTVKTRVLNGSEWSPLAEESYLVERDPIHAWNFEDAATYQQPSFTYGGAALSITPGGATTVERNDAAQSFDTAHLRVNNPIGATVTLTLPTTGFQFMKLDYLTRRSGQGAGAQTLEYTTNGGTWQALDTLTVLDAAPQARSFSLSHLPAVNNNPLFALRVTFTQGGGGTGGNNRFDDLTLSGIRIPGHNFPPAATGTAPVRSDPVEGASALSFDPSGWFSDADNDPLTFAAESSVPAIATASVNAGQVIITPLQRGETTVSVSANDGHNTPVSIPLRVLVHPAPHPLSGGAVTFTAWDSGQPAHTYPPRMLFLQGAENDSTLTTALDRAYQIPEADAAVPADAALPYAATQRTRMNGLGADGVAFINTGRGRDLGGAVLACDTTGMASASLRFTTGTVTPNVRVYAIRLQYRLGVTGPFSDVLDGGSPVEYTRNASAGHSTTYGPFDLPAAVLGQPYVQLLWRYHLVSGASGARAQLRLDDVLLSADYGPNPATYGQWLGKHLTDPVLIADPLISGPLANPSGDGIANLLRYAHGAGPLDPVSHLLPVMEVTGADRVFRFRLDATKPDLIWRVRASNDLDDWPFILFDSSVTPVPPLQDGWLHIPVPSSLQGLPDADAQSFLQLQIERPM